MQAPLAPDRRLWAAQPGRVNWSSRQAAGLAAWWAIPAARGEAVLREPVRNLFSTLQTGATWVSDPLFDSVLRVDGTAGHAATGVMDFVAPLTLTAWCCPEFTNGTGLQAFAKVLCKPHYIALDPYAQVSLGTDNASPAHWSAQLATFDAGSSVSAVSTQTVLANVWTHLGLTYDSTTLRLYVNGHQDGSATTSLVIGLNNTGCIFGRLPGVSGNNFFLGTLLDIRWYTRALGDADIWQLYDPATRWELYAPSPLGLWGMVGAPSAPTAQPHVHVMA